MKKIINFFREMFRDDAGESHLKEKKVNIKWVIYWIIGVASAVLIPTCLVYLESSEFNWNVIAIVWAEDSNIYRVGYFIFGISTIFLFLLLGYLTPENINGNQELLTGKKILRFFTIVSLLFWIVCFIAVNILV